MKKATLFANLLRLTLKETEFFFRYAAVILPLMTVYWLIRGGELDLDITVISCGYIYMNAFIPAIFTEYRERKDMGTEFLSTLPVNRPELVGSKFAAGFLSVAILVAYTLAMFSFFPATVEIREISTAYALFTGFTALTILGVFYTVTVRAKNRFAFMTTEIVLVAVIAVPIILQEVVTNAFGLDTADLAERIAGMNAIAIPIVGTALYAVLVYLALKEKKGVLR